MNKKRVLAIDDDESVLETLRTSLEIFDYVVDKAETETELWAALDQYRPDAILMDVNMPGIDGISLCRKLKNSPRTSEIPVIMLTAYSDEKTFHDAVLFGAADFLMKPFDINEVRKKVEDAISKSLLEKGKGK